MGDRIQRKYGESATINFELYKLDGSALETGAVHVSGDIYVSKDEAAFDTSTNGFVDEGVSYSLVLTAAEMTAARVAVIIADATSPKAWLDKSIFIETYGHTSAQHAFDLDTATQNVNVASQSNIDFGALQKTSLNAATPVLSTTGVNAVVDAVWNEDATTHTTADTAGERLNAIHDMETGDMAIVGTTQTFKKQDGVTTRKVFTLNSATAATSRTGA